MEEIFGVELMKQFKQKRPAGFIDLMVAFESRKRGRILHLAIFLTVIGVFETFFIF